MRNVLPTYEQRSPGALGAYAAYAKSVKNLRVAHWSVFGILYIKMEGIGTVFMKNSHAKVSKYIFDQKQSA